MHDKRLARLKRNTKDTLMSSGPGAGSANFEKELVYCLSSWARMVCTVQLIHVSCDVIIIIIIIMVIIL